MAKHERMDVSWQLSLASTSLELMFFKEVLHVIRLFKRAAKHWKARLRAGRDLFNGSLREKLGELRVLTESKIAKESCQNNMHEEQGEHVEMFLNPWHYSCIVFAGGLKTRKGTEREKTICTSILCYLHKPTVAIFEAKTGDYFDVRMVISARER